MAKNLVCHYCEKVFNTNQSSKTHANKYCSQICYRQGRKGQHTKRYNGGHISASGYHIIIVHGEKIPEHRYVMQQHIGRPLLKTEVVHHRDSNRLNNRIENLELLPSNSAHRQHHFGRYRTLTSKQCAKCLIIKSRDDFYLVAKNRKTDQHATLCKKCHCEDSNARYHRKKLLKNH